METVEMTVHEALCEVKVMGKRLDKCLNEADFIQANKQSNTRINGVTISEYEDAVQASYNRVSDLVRRSDAIKAGLAVSNASTVVKIAGKEMTVAEAIYHYQYGINTKRMVLREMERQYKEAVEKVNARNGDFLDRNLAKYLSDNFGSKDKTDAEVIKDATDKFIQNNTYALVDPLKLREKIESLRDEIDSFLSEVDSALQVSNATTKITISY